MMALPVTIRPRIGSLVRLLASDRDGEVVNACRALGRTLKANGADFHDLAGEIEKPPAERIVVQWRDRPAGSASDPHDPAAEPRTWRDLAMWCRANDRGRLAENERVFVTDMIGKLILRGEPSERQGKWLRTIYARLNGGSSW